MEILAWPCKGTFLRIFLLPLVGCWHGRVCCPECEKNPSGSQSIFHEERFISPTNHQAFFCSGSHVEKLNCMMFSVSFFYTYISDINSRCIVGSQYWPVHVYTSFSLITESLIFDKLLHGCVSFYCTTSLEMWKLDRVFLISSLQSQFFFFFFLYTMYMKLWFRRFYLLQMPVLWIRNGVRLGYMMKNTCKTDPLLHKRFTELLHAVLRGHDRLSNFIRKRKFVGYIVY